MAIFYDDAQRGGGDPVPYDRINATRGYLRHYDNYLILDAIAKAPKNTLEKLQALKELTICERKMAWMQKHPNFNVKTVTEEVAKLKALWGQR